MRNEFSPGQFNNFDLMGKQVTGGRSSLPEVDANEFWLENSRLLFRTIKEVYSAPIAWEENHAQLVINYLMERKDVPENLARASVHAFNEIAEDRLGRVKEATLETLLRMHQKNPSREFTSKDVKVLTNNQGQPLSYAQASKELMAQGIALSSNPVLDQAVRIGTSDTEANRGASLDSRGRTTIP